MKVEQHAELVHHYVSTACQHGLHERCRRECKFCKAKCACECGHPKSTPPARRRENSDETNT